MIYDLYAYVFLLPTKKLLEILDADIYTWWIQACKCVIVMICMVKYEEK